jgi:hypothetical protein
MPPAPTSRAKPYVTLASRLVFAGMILFGIEQFGLDRLKSPDKSIQLDPNLLSALVIVPILLVIAGALIFVVGRMRGR